MLASPIITVFSFFFFYSVTFTTSLSSNSTLLNCTNSFSCGTLRNLTYPFTGGDRPAYCGPPEFHITCVNDSPQLTIMSLDYRVLSLDQAAQNLSLARMDLWNETCTHVFRNSSLSSESFTFSDVNNVDVTIFYGCNSTSIGLMPENWFHCDINQTFDDAYYLIGPVPFDPIMSAFKCFIGITVPILKIRAADLVANRSLFKQSIMYGFNANYTNPYSNQCNKCLNGNGQCGFDSDKNRPVCICGDRLCDPPENHKKLKLGLAGGVVGIVVILVILCCFRRKLSSIFFWKKQNQNYKNLEAFLSNVGPLQVKRYSYLDVKRMTNSFEEKLGQGGYGGVYKGKLRSGPLVAVKVLNRSKGNGEDFMNEVAAISRTSHVNIVSLLGFCFEGSKRALVYEFMPNRSLEKFIFDASNSQGRHLGWEALLQISLGIARGLEYLHRGCNTRILHFDIKPHNILLDENFLPKISDFGLAKICDRKESIVSMLYARGTVGYIAPEVLYRIFGEVSHKSDVYSYGMMLSDMAGGRRNINVEAENTSEIYFPHWIYNRLELDEDLGLHSIKSEEDKARARKVIIVSLWCIQTYPSNRPAMKEVIEMLEGSVESLKIPPKPYLSSPPRSPAVADSSSTLVSIQ